MEYDFHKGYRELYYNYLGNCLLYNITYVIFDVSLLKSRSSVDLPVYLDVDLMGRVLRRVGTLKPLQCIRGTRVKEETFHSDF